MENKAVEGSSALLQGSFYHQLPRAGIVLSAACCPLAAHLGQDSPPQGRGETQEEEEEEEGVAKGMVCTAGFGKNAPIVEGLEQAIAAGVQKRSEEGKEESLTPGSGNTVKASSGDQQRPCVYVHNPLLWMEGGEEVSNACRRRIQAYTCHAYNYAHAEDIGFLQLTGACRRLTHVHICNTHTNDKCMFVAYKCFKDGSFMHMV
jgi:hypothetical protein